MSESNKCALCERRRFASHKGVKYCIGHLRRATGEIPKDKPFRKLSGRTICSGPDCKRVTHGGGLCRPHHRQMALGMSLTAVSRREKSPAFCSLSGCGMAAEYRGLCSGHAQRRKKAEADGTLGGGDWKTPIKRRRTGHATVDYVRFPRTQLPMLQAYAARRGIPTWDAVVELALRQLAQESERGERGPGIPNFEAEDRAAIVRRMVKDGMATEDIRAAIPGLGMDAMHARVSRIRKEMARV